MSSLIDLPPADRHRVVSAGLTKHADAVSDWEITTPVDGWMARDIVSHLVDWSTGFLSAGGVTLPLGPTLDDEPSAAWRAHCDSVQALLDGPAAESPFTHPMTGTHRLVEAVDRFYTADVSMHTWDLATAAGREPGLDPYFAAQLVTEMASMDEVLRSSGQYGPAVPVPAESDPVTRLAGFIGRNPAWSRS